MTLKEMREQLENAEQKIFDEGWAAMFAGSYDNPYTTIEEIKCYDNGYFGAAEFVDESIMPSIKKLVQKHFDKEGWTMPINWNQIEGCVYASLTKQ